MSERANAIRLRQLHQSWNQVLFIFGLGKDESHPLASLMEIVGVLIEKYEDEHVPELAIE